MKKENKEKEKKNRKYLKQLKTRTKNISREVRMK
jgi:hypothetical protein